MILAAGGSATFLVELGALFLALAAVARLAHRSGISPIPLFLLAGLALGEGGVADLEGVTPFVETGATIGVTLLLFFLGLEYTPPELVTTLRREWPTGLVDLLANATPGAAVAWLAGWGPEAALLLAGVTYISSSGIIAKLLGDLGRLGNRETPGIIAVLVLEDLAMALYLPVVAVVLAGRSSTEAVVAVVAAVGLVVAVFVAAHLWGAGLSRLVFSPSREATLFAVLGLTLLVAGIAEEVEVSAAVGAFLVGMAVSGPAQQAAHELLEPLRDLFAAAFFVFFALKIDPATIPSTLPLAGVLALLTGLTKVGTGWWGARRAGIGPRGRVRAGTTLVARGEFSIVVAGLGLAAGVEPELSRVTATYVLITAVTGPLLARSADRWVPTRFLLARPGG